MRAAWLWAGEASILSGAAAAYWHGLLPPAPSEIEVTLPRDQQELLQHGDWIKREVLATRLDAGDVDAPTIAKA